MLTQKKNLMNRFTSLLEETMRRIENPMVFIDTSYRLLAHTACPVSDDPIWNELLQRGDFSPETVDFFQRARFIAAVAGDDAVALLQSGELPYDRACCKVYDEAGVQLGAVTVVSCVRPFAPEDFAELTALCERLTEANRRAGAQMLVEHAFQDSFMTELLEGGNCPEGLDALEQSLGGAWFFTIVADISLYDPSLSHLAYFRDTLQALLPGSRGFLYLNNVVLLLGAPEPRFSVRPALEEFCRAHSLYAGLSEGFRELRDLKKHYRQALESLGGGFGQPCDRHVFSPELLGLERLIHLVHDEAALAALCPPRLRALAQPLRETLHVSLLHGQDRAQSCAQLGVSEQTLHTRLLALQAQLEIDWLDGNQLASLLLGLKILEAEGKN
ncbi:MAG: helix-turn-helix domain-containing protein [Oscillospiraceae bacterium]|jgi:hypothetical protein|nr:helix-turn-helix domain-containing protein [Oscillospiraceae bacterium]